MSKINIAVIQFPGSNCEREALLAIERVGMRPHEVMWNSPAPNLERMDGYVIVGGFSYEDRGRSGLIASKDPLLKCIAAQAAQGKPVLGICNGAQILVESGLVPGLPDQQIGMALTHNKRVKNGQVLGTGYYNDWCHVKASRPESDSVFGQYLNQPMHIPLAHGEGRFIVPEPVYQALQERGASLWQYCDAQGDVNPEFPVNPNGSSYNLAAVSNAEGNVLAIMPHPERTVNGDVVFASMRNYIQSGKKQTTVPLKATLQAHPVPSYQLPPHSEQLLIRMTITDNEAISVQKALQSLGYPVQLSKYVHWELAADSLDPETLLQRIADSYELYNPNKEYTAELAETPNSVAWLVREHEDSIARQKFAVLRQQCNLTELKRLERGIVWQVTAINTPIAPIAERLQQNSILFNPFAHYCYQYT